MTHRPTLPNGFSKDFIEARKLDEFLVYFADETWDGDVEPRLTRGWFDADGVLKSGAGTLTQEFAGRPLCWCPIPTPGDDVLKQLAGAK